MDAPLLWPAWFGGRLENDGGSSDLAANRIRTILYRRFVAQLDPTDRWLRNFLSVPKFLPRLRRKELTPKNRLTTSRRRRCTIDFAREYVVAFGSSLNVDKRR